MRTMLGTVSRVLDRFVCAGGADADRVRPRAVPEVVRDQPVRPGPGVRGSDTRAASPVGETVVTGPEKGVPTGYEAEAASSAGERS